MTERSPRTDLGILREKLVELTKRPTGYIYRGDVRTLEDVVAALDQLVSERDLSLRFLADEISYGETPDEVLSYLLRELEEQS